MKAFVLTAPLLVGGILGLIFPYYGSSLSFLGFAALLLLSVLNFVPISFLKRTGQSQFSLRQLTCYLLGFIAIPCLQLLFIRWFINDKSILFAVALSALAPVAIVAPQFCEENEKSTSVLFILISTLTYPLISYLFLSFLNFQTSAEIALPFVKDVIALTAFPIGISFLIRKFAVFKSLRIWKKIQGHLPAVNMSIIGFLVFIYMGSSFAKSNTNLLSTSVAVVLFANAMFQDFGTYFLFRYLGFTRSEAINFSIKNLALAGAIILTYVPAGIFACSIAFAAHFLFFTFLFLNHSYSKSESLHGSILPKND